MAEKRKQVNLKPEDVPFDVAARILDFINTKSAEEIDAAVSIPGEVDLGIKLARRLVEEAIRLGGYSNLQELLDTKYIGKERFSEIVTALEEITMAESNDVVARGMTFEVSQADLGANCTRVTLRSKDAEGVFSGTNVTMGVEASEESPNFQSNTVIEMPFAPGLEKIFQASLCEFCASLKEHDISNPMCDVACPPKSGSAVALKPLSMNFQIRSVVENGERRVEANGNVGGIPLTIKAGAQGKGLGARAHVEFISPAMVTMGPDGAPVGNVDYVRAVQNRHGLSYHISVTKPHGTKIMDVVRPSTMTDVCGMPVPLNFPFAGTLIGPLFGPGIAGAVIQTRETLGLVSLVAFNANPVMPAAAQKCNKEVFELFGAGALCIIGVIAAGVAAAAGTPVAQIAAMTGAAYLCVGGTALALLRELLVHLGVLD